MMRRFGAFGRLAVGTAGIWVSLLAACGGGDEAPVGSGTGGVATTGGAGTGGALTGGMITGGVVTGGVATGGVVTGGVATGGAVTGGVTTGGVVTGGVTTGGAVTGGVVTGGVTTGGAVTGGEATGGAPLGGTLTGGAETGGVVTGGAAGAVATGGQGGAGTGGEGTGGGLTLIGEIDRGGGSYVLEFGDIYFEVDARNGARVVSCSLGGTEVLMQSEPLAGASDPDMRDNFGATFWTSPQSMWSWPPVDAIDSGNYTAVVEGNSVTLTSPVATVGSAQVVISKRFTADLEHGFIVAEYTIENRGSSAVTMAHWEIPRVDTQGISFFPTGTGTKPVDMTLLEPSSQALGVTWYDWASATPSGSDGKYISDGGGWLAHADDGVLLVRTFDDIGLNDGAEGEAEIKIYANGSNDYAEIEAQGAAENIPAGGSVTWSVIWQLAAIPGTVEVAAGSQSLLDLAESVAAQTLVGG